jgi:hypothetical protein
VEYRGRSFACSCMPRKPNQSRCSYKSFQIAILRELWEIAQSPAGRLHIRDVPEYPHEVKKPHQELCKECAPPERSRYGKAFENDGAPGEIATSVQKIRSAKL